MADAVAADIKEVLDVVTSGPIAQYFPRSEEHTSELQSHHDLVCRLLLEKKTKIQQRNNQIYNMTHMNDYWQSYLKHMQYETTMYQ